MRAFNAAYFRIGCIFVLALYWEIAAPPALLALTLFRVIRVPNFGASSPRSPGQSRNHTLLPERPRMPEKGFMDGDWTTRS